MNRKSDQTKEGTSEVAVKEIMSLSSMGHIREAAFLVV